MASGAARARSLAFLGDRTSGGVLVAIFLGSLSFGMLQLALPLSLRAAHAPASVIGVTLSMLGVGFFVFELGWGIVADRFGAPRTLVVSMLALACAMASFVVAAGVVALALLALVAAGMLDAAGPAGRSYLTGALPERARGAGLGALTGSWSLGTAAGAPLAGFMVDHVGFRALFLAGAAFPLLGALILLWSFRSPGRRSVRVAAPPTPRLPLWPLAMPMRTLLVASVGVMLLLLGTGAESAFVPVLVTGPLRGDAVQAGVAMAVVGGASALLMIPGGRLGDTWGRPAVLVGAGLAAAGLVGYALAGTYSAVLVAAALRAAGAALAWPALTAVLADAAPPESRGFVMAIFGEFESVGLALGPLIAGFVAGPYGYGTALGVMAALVALAGVTGLAMGPRRGAPRRNSA